MLKKISLILKNKVILYIVSRYFSYFIQFVNSILIAKYLGPYYLGVWGFITLAIQYLNQINLGISHSVNAIISVHKYKKWYVEKIIGTSLFMILVLSLLVIIFFLGINLLDLELGNKYEFEDYTYFVVIIGVLGYFNSLFSNISRVQGKVFDIAFNQSSLPVFTFLALILFNGDNLIWALIWAYLIAFIFSFLLYVLRIEYPLKPLFIFRLIKKIQVKGFYLFIYNTSFYLIIIVTRSFISNYYTVIEFGYFTFAYTFANVALLLLQSFSFLVFPKLISLFSNSSNEKATELLSMVRKIYIILAHFLIHLFILVFPVFVTFFSQYQSATDIFKLIALAIVLYANSFGYTGFLIAKEKEKQLARIAFFALLLNVFLLYFTIVCLKIQFHIAVIGTLISNLFFILLIGYRTMKELTPKSNVIRIVKEIFPLSLFLPYILSFSFILLQLPNIYFLIPVVLLILFNKKTIFHITKFGKEIIKNPNLIDV